jgi:type II secretory pathway pseudopilin PulG
VNELGIVYVVLGLLAAFVIIGALLPRYLPSLVAYINANVLKEEKGSDSAHPH